MMLDGLIGRAAAWELRAEEFNAAARAAGISSSELTDAFARAVADGFRSGVIPWVVGDEAMNWLIQHSLPEDGVGVLSPLAERVFEAFDQGEFIHRGEPEDRQGEARTRTLLNWALTGDEEHLAPFGPESTRAFLCAAAASLAKEALDGEGGAISAVRELVVLLRDMKLADEDPDVFELARFARQTAHLPLGVARRDWAPEALAAKDVEIAAAEKWAQEFGRRTLQSVILRFGGADGPPESDESRRRTEVR